jgi:hypothetical protein
METAMRTPCSDDAIEGLARLLSKRVEGSMGTRIPSGIRRLSVFAAGSSIIRRGEGIARKLRFA